MHLALPEKAKQIPHGKHAARLRDWPANSGVIRSTVSNRQGLELKRLGLFKYPHPADMGVVAMDTPDKQLLTQICDRISSADEVSAFSCRRARHRPRRLPHDLPRNRERSAGPAACGTD